MASNKVLRLWHERPAPAGRFSALRARARLLRHLATPLAIAIVVFAATQLASYGPKTTPVPAFVNHALGAPQPHAPLTRRPAPDLSITIEPHGFTLNAGAGGALTLTDAGLTAATTRYANGTLARTGYGKQAIPINKPKGEVDTFATVRHRLGLRTWRWRLGTSMDPRVSGRGWVGFFENNHDVDFAIRPVGPLELAPRRAK